MTVRFPQGSGFRPESLRDVASLQVQGSGNGPNSDAHPFTPRAEPEGRHPHTAPALAAPRGLHRSESDTALVARARGGDNQAWDELWRRYAPRLEARSRRYFPDRETAEDLAITAWEQAWRSLPQYRERGKFLTWLLILLANAAHDEARRRRARVETTALRGLEEVLPLERREYPEQQVLRAERMAAVETALAALREAHPEQWEAVARKWLPGALEGEAAEGPWEWLLRHRGLRWLRRFLLARYPDLFAEMAEPAAGEPRTGGSTPLRPGEISRGAAPER